MAATDPDRKSYQSEGAHDGAAPVLAKTDLNDPNDVPLLVKQTQAGIWKVEAAANVSRVTVAQAINSRLTPTAGRSGAPPARHCYGSVLLWQGERTVVRVPRGSTDLAGQLHVRPGQ